MRTIRTFQLAAILLLFLSMSACRTAREPLRPEPIGALPPVPSVDGELEITLVHPPPGQTRPDVDSTFVFGDVGTGEAELTINGEPVPVARNGAFLAYVPVRSDGTYTLVARANGERATKTYRYREEEIRPPQPVPVVPPRLAFVRSEGRDTVDTGSETAYALTSPNGRRLMFMLPETPLRVTGRLSNHYRVELGAERSAWVPEAALVLTDSVAGSWPAIETLEVRPAPDYVDVRIGGGHPSFIVHADAKSVSLSVFGLDARHAPVLRAEDPWIESAALTGASADSLHIRLELSSPLWGYKAFHDDEGALVVRLRRPPSVDAAQPLAGLR
ncbi:MAG: hypothetical protein ACOCTG_01945, partial [Bacteroidota bacterium]